MTPNKNPITNDRKKTAYTYNFIFLFVPINFRFPPKKLYIEKAKNGNYNEDIDNIICSIKEILKNNGLRTLFLTRI